MWYKNRNNIKNLNLKNRCNEMIPLSFRNDLEARFRELGYLKFYEKGLIRYFSGKSTVVMTRPGPVSYILPPLSHLEIMAQLNVAKGNEETVIQDMNTRYWLHKGKNLLFLVPGIVLFGLGFHSLVNEGVTIGGSLYVIASPVLLGTFNRASGYSFFSPDVYYNDMALQAMGVLKKS